MAQTSSTDLLEASLRHLRDAEHLAGIGQPCQQRSLPQAYHLAGFGPECARKAAIAAPWTTKLGANKLLSHEIGDGAEAIMTLIAMLEPRAAFDALRDWGRSYPELAQWAPECRYWPERNFQADKVQEIIRESQLVVHEIIARLWGDGQLRWKDFSK
ncbi:MAG TPA: hypothetical protein PKA58_07985 [Polyangium sp.]|nr:hypothetical protein [Polyangium sp.]